MLQLSGTPKVIPRTLKNWCDTFAPGLIMCLRQKHTDQLTLPRPSHAPPPPTPSGQLPRIMGISFNTFTQQHRQVRRDGSDPLHRGGPRGVLLLSQVHQAPQPLDDRDGTPSAYLTILRVRGLKKVQRRHQIPSRCVTLWWVSRPPPGMATCMRSRGFSSCRMG